MENKPTAIERIRQALAAGPTPGEWSIGEALDGARCVRANQVGGSIFIVACHPEHPEAEANDNYIAACSPDAIRSLLSRLDELEKDASLYHHWKPWLERRLGDLAPYEAAIDSAIAKGA